MSELRNQFTAAHRGYQDCHYNGSLAEDIGLNSRTAAPLANHGFRWRWLLALAAMAAVVILLRHNNETIETTITPAAKVADSGAAHLSAPRRVTPNSTSNTLTATTTETTAVDSSAPSLSFESITDWPSVSADVPSLGGFPSPTWNTQETQTPTTQESAS